MRTITRSTELELLEVLLRATKSGGLIWERRAPGEYQAKGSTLVSVTEVCPLVAGDAETKGVQAFELEVDSLTISFWSGTEGAEKIREILSAGLPEWAEHRILSSQKLRDVIKRFKTK